MLARSVAILILAAAMSAVASAAPADNVRLHVNYDLSADQIKGNCLRQIATANNRVNALMASHVKPTATASSSRSRTSPPISVTAP